RAPNRRNGCGARADWKDHLEGAPAYSTPVRQAPSPEIRRCAARTGPAGPPWIHASAIPGGIELTAPNLAFPTEEYAARLARTRAAMAKAGIEVLIVTDPSNMNWLTGYDGWSFYVHQAVIVPSEGEPLWFGRPQDVNGAKLTTWLDAGSMFSYPDHYVQNPSVHPYQILAAVLREKGLAGARLGVEMDNYYF